MSNENSTQIAYIYGRLEAQIEAFANSSGVSFRELAGRLATLLLGATSGKVLGTSDRVSQVPREAQRRKTVAKVAMVKRPSGKSLSVAQLRAMRKNIARARQVKAQQAA